MIFPPSRSRKYLSRHGDQDIRIVILDAIDPVTDGAPLVGTVVGFTHQLEEARLR